MIGATDSLRGKQKTYMEGMIAAIKSTPFCEYEQVRIGVLSDGSPLLGLAFHFRSSGFRVLVKDNILYGDRVLVQSFNIVGVRVGEGVNMFEGPECRVTSPRPFAISVRVTGNTNRLLVDRDEGGSGAENIEGVSELNVFRAVLLAHVERRTGLLHLFFSAKRPQNLELGVVQKQADGEDFG
jgi:hypothetical protein